MNKTDQSSYFSKLVSTIENLSQLLGFHDLASFFISMAALAAALAFVISCAIFLVKKHRQRKLEIEQVVKQVQAEVEERPKQKAVSAPSPLVTPLKTPSAPAAVEKPAIKIPEKPLEKIKPATAVKIETKQTEALKPTPVAEVKEEIKKEIKIVKEPEHKAPVEKGGLGAALKNTRGGFIKKFSMLFSGAKEISDDDFEQMEAILFGADIGVKTAQKLLESMRERSIAEKKTDAEFMRRALKDEMRKILNTAEIKDASEPDSPSVLMFVGVNGAGKTTSIGKLGAQLVSAGKKVVFGAGDTYRAAAVKQLCLWGERIGATVVSGKEKSDPSSVLFDTIKRGKEENADFILCDTAGRLHTKVELMEELKKVNRVVGKAHEGAPQEVFLVVDATMGQNAIMQAREFAAATPLTGVILSKLDGTAKGGVALGIVDELKIPIKYIGIGEQPGDLRKFDADEFVDALFEEV